MALTRKFLSALGIEETKIDEIINAHTETVDALKEQRDQFKADAAKLPAVEKELDQLKEAQKTGEHNAYEEKYNKLKAEFDEYKTSTEKKELTRKKAEAYEALLKETGVSEKRVKSILKVTNLEGVELDDNGGIKGKEELAQKLKEEWADFIPTQHEQGAKTANPQSNTGGTKMTKEQIFAIKDTAARQKAISENIELFE